MNDRDWAIVVGIKSYTEPTLKGLEGPENDARDFYEWVSSPDGGGVPEGQRKLILSSDFPPEEPNPTAVMIQTMFDHLDNVDRQHKEARRAGPFGRRLWIFFAGHGFAPDIDDKLTALLTAEAAAGAFHQAHVIVSKLADFCWRAAYFEEIFMFADCCRTVMPCTQLNVAKKQDKRGRNFDEVRTFYAYGARIGKESREWAPDGNTYRGVFTMTLMEGLRGAAADPKESKPVITAESLDNFLHNNFTSFMVPRDREQPGIRREPEVHFEHRSKKLVIGPVPAKSITERFFGGTPTKYKVRVVAQSENAAGQPFQIVRSSKTVAEGKVGDDPLELDVGLYVLLVPALGKMEPFEVQARKETLDVPV